MGETAMNCTHRWLLNLPKGGVVRGSCKLCNAPYEREEVVYREFGDAVHDERVRAAQSELRAQLPMYRPYHQP